MFRDMTIDTFLEDLASPKPVPGGATALALSGAIAASLLGMFSNHTAARKEYRDVEPVFRSMAKRAEIIKVSLVELMDASDRAVGRVSEAHSLPGSTDEEKALRSEAIQNSLRKASAVPL